MFVSEFGDPFDVQVLDLLVDPEPLAFLLDLALLGDGFLAFRKALVHLMDFVPQCDVLCVQLLVERLLHFPGEH
jgi:hypothetical protein